MWALGLRGFVTVVSGEEDAMAQHEANGNTSGYL